MKSAPTPLNKVKVTPFIEDVFYEFFSFINLDVKFILNCRLVCKEWNYLIMNSNLWNYVEAYVFDIHKLPEQFKFLLTRIKCNTKIDNDLKHVSKFKKLQQLDLSRCKQITDNGLKHLQLTSLRQLNLGDCHKITNIGRSPYKKRKECFSRSKNRKNNNSSCQ